MVPVHSSTNNNMPTEPTFKYSDIEAAFMRHKQQEDPDNESHHRREAWSRFSAHLLSAEALDEEIAALESECKRSTPPCQYLMRQYHQHLACKRRLFWLMVALAVLSTLYTLYRS